MCKCDMFLILLQIEICFLSGETYMFVCVCASFANSIAFPSLFV